MKPILFNTEMVRAILEGRKTVTRRVVKFMQGKNPNWTGYIKDGLTLYNGTNEPCNMPAPYRVNDILWVRETWREIIKPVGAPKEFDYRADKDKRVSGLFKWKPSIHMPKEAARIFLRVTDVRVERLQDMKLIDYLAEGISNLCDSCNRFPFDKCDTCGREGFMELSFIALWNSTQKTDQMSYYGYSANPYVWVIEFDVISKEEALAGSSSVG